MNNFRWARLGASFGKTLWPRYRGKRAGRLVKLRENCQKYPIHAVQPSESRRTLSNSIFTRHRNLSNCIRVVASKHSGSTELVRDSQRVYVPSFFLSNVMSLAPKPTTLYYKKCKSGLPLYCRNVASKSHP